MASDNEKSHGYPTLPEVISVTSCPRIAKPTTTTTKPAATPTPTDLTCWPESRRPGPDYGAVRPDQYKEAVDKACAAFKKQSGLNNAGRGSYVYQSKDGEVPYWFSVGPKNSDQGCDTKNLVDPFGDGSIDCSKILKDDVFGACELSDFYIFSCRSQSLTLSRWE